MAAEATRGRILTAALDAFSNRPYAAVTVSEIARSAGVAQGLLSHHFAGKEGLYVAVVHEADARLRTAQGAGVAGEAPPVTRLRQRFRAHAEFLALHEGLAVHLILRRAGATEVAWEAFESTRRQGVRELCRLLDLDAEAPAVQLPMRAFAAAVDDLTLNWLLGGRPFTVDVLVDTLVDLLSGALRAARRLAPDAGLDATLACLEDREH
ncbi:TetR/AcrR family transcriptional regulator [Streptomyces sp. NPDC002309]